MSVCRGCAAVRLAGVALVCVSGPGLRTLLQVNCQPHIEPNLTTANIYDITGVDGSIELLTASALGGIQPFDWLHAVDFQRSGSHLADAQLSMYHTCRDSCACLLRDWRTRSSPHTTPRQASHSDTCSRRLSLPYPLPLPLPPPLSPSLTLAVYTAKTAGKCSSCCRERHSQGRMVSQKCFAGGYKTYARNGCLFRMPDSVFLCAVYAQQTHGTKTTHSTCTCLRCLGIVNTHGLLQMPKCVYA